MANINVKDGSVFTSQEVAVGSYFTVEFRLNNRETLESFGGGCSWRADDGYVLNGHLSKPRLQVVDSGGSVVMDTSEFASIDPPQAEKDGNNICCPIESLGDYPDPLVKFEVKIDEVGEYSIVAISDPYGNPEHSVTVSVDVLEPEDIDEGDPGGPGSGDGGGDGDGEDGGGEEGSNFLQFAKNNPLLAGVGGVAAIVAVREGTNAIITGDE